ncbi:MAG: ATP-dependent DNA helicase UvrD2 [Nitrospira sp.]|nr:ATP-dependent DNA helicase UvrD2 [Nitrospira sp.]
MGRIERHIGGPGTGKTKLILDRLTEVKNERGLSVEEIGLCTFTRAGRQELAARAAAEWGCEVEALTQSGWFRTAHSMAYRQIGVESGQLIEGAEGAAWIGEALGGKVATRYDARSREVSFASASGDDSLTLALSAWDLARASMRTLTSVLADWARAGNPVPDVRTAINYITKYESAKRIQGRMDFTDVVSRFAGVKFTLNGPEETLPEGDVPVGMRALAIDEAQDSSVLVDRVCRRLADSPSIERVFLSGDAFQSIYSFSGGDYRLFLNWEAEEYVMPRSYRCPPKVMELGERCIRLMRSGYRDRGIEPASHSGRVSRFATAGGAIEQIDPTESVLILGRCGFSLREYETILQARGIPYSWIDRVGSASELSGYSCLWNLQHGESVHHDDWANAIGMISADRLIRGEKTAWKKGLRSNVDIIRPVAEGYLAAGAGESIEQLVRSGNWPAALDKSHAKKATRWIAAAKRFGPETACNPKIQLSTIHGAKGCEGDTVILSSISSPAVCRGRQAINELHDEECRVNYVAVTRARKNLMIVQDANLYSLDIPA